MTKRAWTLTMCCAAMVACGEGSGPTGGLQVLLTAEETITDGIEAGSGDDQIVDGWSVSFERYVVAIGEVEIESAASTRHLHEHDSLVIDLVQVPEGGETLATFEDVEAILWNEVFYQLTVAAADATRDEGVSMADFDRMVAEGCSYLIVGEITNPAGQRCLRGDPAMCSDATSIAFDLCVPAPTVFGPCESDTGIEGVTVAEGTVTPVVFTLHGDHLFFNGFPAGAEGSVVRRGQWLADADVDADGTVTRADLEAIGASDLGMLLPSSPSDGMPGYMLGGSPITINSAWDYTIAQLKTQGHFQGEGECPVDGVGHEHE